MASLTLDVGVPAEQTDLDGFAERRPHLLRIIVPLFTATLLLSSFLLFLIQPMIAKMMLPILGGSPSVWNTSMVFFQAALLLGYAYAHFATLKLGPRRHAILHITIISISIIVLPIAIPDGWNAPQTSSPALWLLGVLAIVAGLPFFLVASTAPLMQRWFAQSSHRYADDPYFLYRASNAGSIAALLGYPFLIEPYVSLARQAHLWAGGYIFLAALLGACAVAALRTKSAQPSIAGVGVLARADKEVEVTRPSVRIRLLWIVLAFVPSSLMLGVTSHLTTDVAAVPLLWVVPLILYLLTFVLVFGRRPFRWMSFFHKALPISVSLFVFTHMVPIEGPVALLIGLHLSCFFIVAVVCHGRLAATRPSARHLTAFYLYLAIGGVLGGAFNALIAPQIFDSLVEYPLAVVVACALIPSKTGDDEGRWSRPLSFFLPLGLVVGILIGRAFEPSIDSPVSIHLFYLAAFVLLPILIVFSWRIRPIRFAAGVAVLLVVGGFTAPGTTIFSTRTFFGVHSVGKSSDGAFVHLLHGTTLHGTQSTDPSRRREALSYYHGSGPLGQLFRVLHDEEPLSSVGVVGLGTGTAACFSRPGEEWTFYEIDPAIVRIAQDRRLFTYLGDCLERYEVIVGDARISLASGSSVVYDLLIMDAFSSDAIPVHLLTKEALELYEERLAPGGVIAFHISNRHVDLTPVLARLADSTGLVGLVQRDHIISSELEARGKDPSDWVILARQEGDLKGMSSDSRWEPLPDAGGRLWTDDFSNLVALLRWR